MWIIACSNVRSLTKAGFLVQYRQGHWIFSLPLANPISGLSARIFPANDRQGCPVECLFIASGEFNGWEFNRKSGPFLSSSPAQLSALYVITGRWVLNFWYDTSNSNTRWPSLTINSPLFVLRCPHYDRNVSRWIYLDQDMGNTIASHRARVRSVLHRAATSTAFKASSKGSRILCFRRNDFLPLDQVL